MFHKVLIANRGAIACRIIRTLRRMGVGSVAVYSEADRHSLHVVQADEAVVHRPGRRGAELSFVRRASSRLPAATGAEAIHPGYGFLSENADFAEACAAAGIVFIGPTPRADARVRPEAHGPRNRRSATACRCCPGTALLRRRRRGVLARQDASAIR